MSIAARLRIAALTAVIVMLALAALVFQRTGTVNRQLDASGAAVALLDGLGTLRYLTFEYLLYGEPRAKEQWQARHASIAALIAGARAEHPQARTLLARLTTDHERLGRAFGELARSLEQAPSVDAAPEHLREELQRRLGGLVVVVITKMNADVSRLFDMSSAAVVSSMADLRLEVVVAGAGLALLLALLMLLLTRRIVKTLALMHDGARRFGGGELEFRLGVTGRDELGRLARAFDDMAAALQSTTLSRDQLIDSARIVIQAAAEILATVTQVSAGTAQSTVAVTRTTATVEQVRRTAQLSSERSRAVSAGAKKAEDVARSGREAVEKAHEGMRVVQARMQSVARSILQLSERSQAIGEIIETARSVAGQSNILAVNAAIEAAHSGADGAGFAALAHEMRALADQSKQATGQVRALLREIHDATQSAVLAAEEGARAVDDGLDRALEADGAIRALARQVADAAESAVRIAASSQEQVEGVDAVAAEMASIMEATLQNSAGIRQVESAARDLDALGQRLSQQVARIAG